MKTVSYSLLAKIVADLKLSKARLEEGKTPHQVRFIENGVEINGAKYEYEIDSLVYCSLVNLLIEVQPHYPDVIADNVYASLSNRSHSDLVMDILGVHSVGIRRWQSLNGSIQVEGYQLMASGFRGILLGTGGQWLALLRFNRKSWEFYASKQHTIEIGLFPYFCDLFNNGKIAELRSAETLATIFDRVLPDWHPLISEGT